MQPYLAVVTPLANNSTLIQPVNTAAHPEHPIVLPPGGGNGGSKPPSDAHPEHPIYWPPVPTHPIVLPPEAPPGETPPTGPLGKVEWHSVWTEEYGWAVIGVQTDPHPAPAATSKRAK